MIPRPINPIFGFIDKVSLNAGLMLPAGFCLRSSVSSQDYLTKRLRGFSELLPKNETVIMRGLESRRDLHAAVSFLGSSSIRHLLNPPCPPLEANLYPQVRG
jgi:hypothetical protein